MKANIELHNRVLDAFAPYQKEWERWKVSESCFITFSEMKIYNRWGNEVKTSSIEQGWDGNNSDGKPCTDGVYYYVISAKGVNDRAFLLKGFVQLLR
jgi:gliding motility-associated-like protein